MDYFVYDIETYPNCFTISVERYSTRERWVFEISWRCNDAAQFISFIKSLQNIPGAVMVGFNNINFDYPIIHDFIVNNGAGGYQAAYDKCQSIITSNDQFGHIIWNDDRLVPQIDLYKISHFDNKARSTSLKQVEFNMRVPNLQDLPFPVGTMLDSDQIDKLIDYNMNGDVVNTREFLTELIPAIEFRKKLSAQYGHDFMNDNDTKIGKQYFIMSLEQAGVDCYTKVAGQGKKPVQSIRQSIALRDVVLPSVGFRTAEFQRIHQWFLNQTITETKGVFDGVNCALDNFQYDFGLGGIHGSVESQTIHSSDEWIIEDWDVASYYPNIAIANRLYPEHLGEEFCDIYKDVYEQRKSYAKGTAENAVMKLALNGVYGDSNSKYSPFYDSAYTMAITINGQLLLCMLAEALVSNFTQLRMIQINTDGLTVLYPRAMKDQIHETCRQWEEFSKLTLECVEYNRMMIRDVNNYIGEYTDGSLKRKGAYLIDRAHHQNQSALIIPKVACDALVNGINIDDAVRSHTNTYDFLLFTKGNLELDGIPQQRRSRYYVSETGGTLVVVRTPPAGKEIGDYKKASGISNTDYATANVTGLHNPAIHTKNKSVYGMSVTEVEKGWQVTMANDIMDCTAPINYQYYIDRIKKLVEAVK